MKHVTVEVGIFQYKAKKYHPIVNDMEKCHQSLLELYRVTNPSNDKPRTFTLPTCSNEYESLLQRSNSTRAECRTRIASSHAVATTPKHPDFFELAAGAQKNAGFLTADPDDICPRYTSSTPLMQPSFSGLFVTWAYLPHTTFPAGVTSPNSLTFTCMHKNSHIVTLYPKTRLIRGVLIRLQRFTITT